MQPIDYIFRFDPEKPTAKPAPLHAEAARRALQEGNHVFAEWMDACQNGEEEAGSQHLITCNGFEDGKGRSANSLPKHSPFAVVVGCSDARVPLEMLFGQGFNDLFVIRVAGNVLGDECIGSIDFALHALSDSVKIILILGHSGCGAVTGAVNAYLNPQDFWADTTSPMLRLIMQRIIVAVHEAAQSLEKVYGSEIRQNPHFCDVLIDASVAMNAARTAHDMYVAAERAGKGEIKVLYGVFNLCNGRVYAPGQSSPSREDTATLGSAPTNHQDFAALSKTIAESYRDRLFEPSGSK